MYMYMYMHVLYLYMHASNKVTVERQNTSTSTVYMYFFPTFVRTRSYTVHYLAAYNDMECISRTIHIYGKNT